MFVKHDSSGKRVILIVYINDIIFIGLKTSILILKEVLAKELEIKDVDNLKHFLEMEIVRSKKRSSMSQ